MKTFCKLFLPMYALTILTTFAQIETQPSWACLGYQAVLRDNNGNLVDSQSVSVRFSIHDTTATGPVVYKESQNTTTNLLGLITVDIGRGTVLSGSFAGINWGGGDKFLQIELDTTGGNNYIDMGTTQLLSVPYALRALHSGSADSTSDNRWSLSGLNIYNNNTGNVGIGTSNPGSKLSVIGQVAVSSDSADDASPPGGLGSQALLRMNLRGSSDTAVVVGSSTVVRGSGNVLKASDTYMELSTPDVWGIVIGSNAQLTARDSVTGSNMNLKGGSDSAVVIGNRIVVRGGGKEFIGNVLAYDSASNDDPHDRFFKAVGTDLRLTARDSVTGSNMNLIGGSDSTIAIGQRTVFRGRGKEFTGYEVATEFASDSSSTNSDSDSSPARLTIGMKMNLRGRDSVTGSNINLRGGSDSAVVVGNSITGSGSGKEFIGNVTSGTYDPNYDQHYWLRAVGSDIRLTARDSVTGSNAILRGGSDSAVVIGQNISVSGRGKSFIAFHGRGMWEIYPDTRFNSSTGFDINLAAINSVTGSDMNLKGGSDSAVVIGNKVTASGIGKRLTGYSVASDPGSGNPVYVWSIASGAEIQVGAADSVIGNNMNLTGGSDSAIVIGNSITIHGKGKKAIGDQIQETLSASDREITVFTAVDVNISARDSVIGSHSVLRGGSDSAIVIGNSVTGSGIGKKFIGNVTLSRSMADTAIQTWLYSVGSDIRLTARDSVTGSNMNLRGGSDSAVIIGQKITYTGNGKEFIGNVQSSDNDANWQFAVGSDTRLTARDSVTGSNMKLTGGSDSAVVIGSNIELSGRGSVLIAAKTRVDSWVAVVERHSKIDGHQIMINNTDADTARGVNVKNSNQRVNIGGDFDVSGGTNNIGLRSVTDGTGAAAIFSGSGGANGLLVPRGNVGIGTSSPNTSLDINGSLAIREVEVPITNAQNNDVTWVENGSGTVVMTQANFPFSLSGLTGGSDGRILILYNKTGQPWTLLNDSGSSPANRIDAIREGDLYFTGNSVVTLQYSLLDQHWVVVSHSTLLDGPLTPSDTNIFAEIAALVAADSALQADIEAEGTARRMGDSILAFRLVYADVIEIAIHDSLARVDSLLQANINAEILARQNADSALQSAIDAEVAARIAGDNGAAGGDLSGNYPNPSVAKIQGTAVSNAAPANGQVLKYNSTSLQWEPAVVTPHVSYEAGLQAPLPIQPNVPTTVIYGTASFNDGLSYNPATGIFTAPATGRYHFDASVQWQQVGAGARYDMQLKVNGVATKTTYSTFNFNQDYTQSLSIDIALTAGDLVTVTVLQNSAIQKNLLGGLTASTFNGHQLY